MSAIDFTHPIGMAQPSGVASIMPVDLTLPPAFGSITSSDDELRTALSPVRPRLLHCLPQVSTPLVSPLSSNLRQTAPSSNRLDFYFQNREFLRFASPPSPSPSSPSATHHHLHSSGSVYQFSLNSSFPPMTYPHRQLHEINHPGAEHPESPASSNMSLTPDRDLDPAASPDDRLHSKVSADSSSLALCNRPDRRNLERFPPAKRFIRTLPLSPSDEVTTTSTITPKTDDNRPNAGSARDESIQNDKSDDNNSDDETGNGAASCEEVDSSFSPRSTLSASFSSPYIIPFTSSLPSSPSGPFHSSLFPVSFVTPEILKSNTANTDTSSPYLKRRHSANNPIVVDSSIPFTTYLHNLTITLQQSAAAAAARGKPASSMSDNNVQDYTKRSRHNSENSTSDTPSFNDTSSSSIANNEETNIKRRKREDNTHPGNERLKEYYNEDEERIHSTGEHFMHGPKEKKKRRTYLSESSVSDVMVHDSKLRFKSVDERNLMTYPTVFTSSAFSLSPDSSVVATEHLHGGSNPFSQQCPAQSQPLPSPQPLQPLAGLSPLRSPRSPRDQHPHLTPAIQFPSLYNKLFPSFGPSPNQPGQLNLSSSLPGSIQAIGGLGSSANRMNSLFHPSFLSLGNLGMRRPSADKPPPVKKYKCDVCQKAFSRSNTLVTHKRIHTGDKPFKCEICGRAFRQPGNLTRHRLTHTTHKPYVCHVCNKAFNRASNLNTHIRTHSSFRQFGCNGCPKPLQFKHDLASHIYSQNGERLFKCDICGRGFAHSSTLATHRRTHSTTDSQSNPLPTH